jgi:predicted Zn-dependent peptidase
VDLIDSEFRRAASEPPAAREVDRAKAQLKTGLLMSYESSISRAGQMAHEMLTYDRLLSAEELIERVEAVTPEAVRAVAERLATGAAVSFALVGAGPDAEAIEARLSLGARS